MVTVFVALPSTLSHGATDFMQKVYCSEKISIRFFFSSIYCLLLTKARQSWLWDWDFCYYAVRVFVKFGPLMREHWRGPFVFWTDGSCILGCPGVNEPTGISGNIINCIGSLLVYLSLVRCSTVSISDVA